MERSLSVQKLQFIDITLKNVFTASQVTPQLVIRDAGYLIAGDYCVYRDSLPLKKTFEINGGRFSYLPYEPDFSFDLNALGLSRGMVSPQNSLQWASENPDYVLSHILSESFVNNLCNRFQSQATNLKLPPIIYDPKFLNNDLIKIPFYVLDDMAVYEVVSLIFQPKQN